MRKGTAGKLNAAELRRMAEKAEDVERERKLRILAEQLEEAEQAGKHDCRPEPG